MPAPRRARRREWRRNRSSWMAALATVLLRVDIPLRCQEEHERVVARLGGVGRPSAFVRPRRRAMRSLPPSLSFAIEDSAPRYQECERAAASPGGIEHDGLHARGASLTSCPPRAICYAFVAVSLPQLVERSSSDSSRALGEDVVPIENSLHGGEDDAEERASSVADDSGDEEDSDDEDPLASFALGQALLR